ncbi:hypothetical protein ACOSP7_031452 [Xanthoceras sorbifolium]
MAYPLAVFCRSSLLSADFVALCVILWRIWYCHNSTIFLNKLLLVAVIVPWSLAFLEDFVKVGLLFSPASVGVRVQPRWEASFPGWFKINFDAAVDSVCKRAGMGVVICDWQCRVMASLSQSYPLLVSVEVAEAMAIHRGLQLAYEIGLSPVGFETDASSLVSFIVKKDPPLSDVGLVAADIIHLVSLLSISHISFVPSSYNGVAHRLAKFGLSISDFLVWMEEVPLCVEDLIQSEPRL